MWALAYFCDHWKSFYKGPNIEDDLWKIFQKTHGHQEANIRTQERKAFCGFCNCPAGKIFFFLHLGAVVCKTCAEVQLFMGGSITLMAPCPSPSV